MAKLVPSFYCYSHLIIMGNSCAYLKYFLFSIFSLTEDENTGSVSYQYIIQDNSFETATR